MKSRIVVLTTFGFLAAFLACNQQTTSETSATTTAAEPPAVALSPPSMTDVATPAPDGSEQIAESVEQAAEDLREETRQAMAAGGAALERGGERLQESVAAVAPQSTESAAQPAPEPSARAEPVTQPAPEQGAQERVADGAVIFTAKCKSCHGADAGGDTAMGRKYSIPDLRSAAVQGLTDAELATVIANGKPGGPSASAHKSKALSEDQIKVVIAYLRSVRM